MVSYSNIYRRGEQKLSAAQEHIAFVLYTPHTGKAGGVLLAALELRSDVDARTDDPVDFLLSIESSAIHAAASRRH